MARNRSMVDTAIWNDTRFRSRTAEGQWLYFVLLTHPAMSASGVVWERKRTTIAGGMAVEQLLGAALDIADIGLIVVDPQSAHEWPQGDVRDFDALWNALQAIGYTGVIEPNRWLRIAEED